VSTTPIRRIGVVNRGEAAVHCLHAIHELPTEEGSDLASDGSMDQAERYSHHVRSHHDEMMEVKWIGMYIWPILEPGSFSPMASRDVPIVGLGAVVAAMVLA
jgi:hypothetical protein